jgi:hypothetical protein
MSQSPANELSPLAGKPAPQSLLVDLVSLAMASTSRAKARESEAEPDLRHDSSTNNLILRNRAGKRAVR